VTILSHGFSVSTGFRNHLTTPGRTREGGRRKLPLAFTEHGAIMVATVLNSGRAVEVSVYVVRAFVKLRELLTSNKELAEKLELLERKLETHDQAIVGILNQIRQLTNTLKRGPNGV